DTSVTKTASADVWKIIPHTCRTAVRPFFGVSSATHNIPGKEPANITHTHQGGSNHLGGGQLGAYKLRNKLPKINDASRAASATRAQAIPHQPGDPFAAQCPGRSTPVCASTQAGFPLGASCHAQNRNSKTVIPANHSATP